MSDDAIAVKAEITRLQTRAAGRLVLMDARMQLRDAWTALERNDASMAARLIERARKQIESDGR